MRVYIKIYFFVFLIKSLSAASLTDSIYFKNFVYHSNNTFCPHIPPSATFTVFLNNDQSKILIENAPRWDPLADPNISGNGTFGIELANFSNPSPNIGDKVFVRFNCASTGEQGLLVDSIDAIPWYRFPLTLNLLSGNYPLPPQNLILNSSLNSRTLTWNLQSGLSYNIYRRSLKDTLSNGLERKLYTLLVSNVVGNSYIDYNVQPNEKYGYIIFSLTSEGIISPHSEEVNDNLISIENLTVISQATVIRLKWNAVSDSSMGVIGYNIYRRNDNGIFGAPIAFTGSDTTYIDTRLELGTDYIYKVKARKSDQTEIAASSEANAVTLSSSAYFYTYANLKTAVVIYQNTNAGVISDQDVVKIKNSLELGKKFYWRNSSLKLNLQFDFILIKEYKNFPDPNDTWGSMILTANHLAEKGVMNTQYDLIFRISRAVYGYWSYGVQNLPLPGPVRKTGFAQVQWPVGTDVIYPSSLTNIKTGLIWVFVHELQHSIDALYSENGHPEMYDGDKPYMFPDACGEHFDFQAKMLRNFSAYENLYSNWGGIYESVDADDDNFPDNDDYILSIDENTFGSSNSLSDSDGDGLSDKLEAINGTFSGSDPNVTDTDHDGLMDGLDSLPRYRLSATIENFKPVIDGVIENGWPLVCDTAGYTSHGYAPKLYMSFDSDSFYLAIHMDKYCVPELAFDWQTDGWWWGSGNTQMKINLLTGLFITFRSWDASTEVRNYSITLGQPGGMWDDDPNYISHFNRKVIYQNSVKLKVYKQEPVYEIEMSIAKRDYAG
ncbi:MAG: fibronectin type III domain-containing protein, partial [Ignavibacteria bacterium]|nr:fibronectin type III domain-containing protein [Ignavibacteria bacterium]